MKKIGIISMLLITLLTGCTNKEENNSIINNESNKQNETVVEDQIYEGLEFINSGVSNGIIKTIVINNTGVIYEGSKISIKIMDSDGNIIKELIDEVKVKMETGTTYTIETKTDADLSNAASIEYSVIK